MINLNDVTDEELYGKLSKLRPGESLRTAEGITVRRCAQVPCYEFVGQPQRYNTPQIIGSRLMDRSAKLTIKDSLGGVIPFHDAKCAREALEAGKAIEGKHYKRGVMSKAKAERIMATMVNIPYVDNAGVVASLEKIIRDKDALPSYRTRARQALRAIQADEPNPGVARGALEALIAHAEREGNAHDASNAIRALAGVRDTYPDAASQALPTPERYTVRPAGVDGGYRLYDGRDPYGTVFTSPTAARDRAKYLNRVNRQQTAADQISDQEAGIPIVKQRVGDKVAA